MEPKRFTRCLAIVITCHALTGASASVRGPAEANPLRPPALRVAHARVPEMPALAPSEISQHYRIRIETDPARPVAGASARVTVWIADAQGRPVTTLQLHHERLVHFLVVSANLEEFHHLHAEDFGFLTDDAKRQGRFTFPVTFAHGGDYAVVLDFVDQGRTVHQGLRLKVDGPPQPATAWRLGRDRKADGLEVRLLTSPDAPEAGSEIEGVLVVSAGGGPVADLEPYLGAPAHLAIFGEGAATSAHLHGEAGAGGHDHGSHASAASPGALGPKIAFGYTFPEPGRYRMFVQFARRGTVYTVPFDVDVSARVGR